jgi:hypothetical protein
MTGPPNGRAHARSGFTVEPNYTPDATNAEAADTTRGGSRVACSECWAAQSLSYSAASPSWKWKMRIGLNKRKMGAAQR